MRKLFAIIALAVSPALAQTVVTASGTLSGSAQIRVNPVTAESICGSTNQLPCSLGWFQMPNTAINTVAPSPLPGGNSGQAAVMSAWGGAMADTTQNRMIIWGGGHLDYFGNEVYSVNVGAVPATVTRLTNPSTFNGACTAAQADGTATSRHTYGILAFMPTVGVSGKMYVFGGALANCGFGTNDTWQFDLTANSWTQITPTGGPPAGCSDCVSEYDPNTNLVFNIDVDSSNIGYLWSYSPGNKTYTLLKNNVIYPGGGLRLTRSGVIDWGRKIFYSMGAGQFLKIDISTGSAYNFTQLETTATGCSTPVAANGPGMAYDPVNKRIVLWAGGDTVYTYNDATNACSPVTFTGGPGAQQANGTFGRFRYFPALGVFVVANAYNQNAFALRMDAPSTLRDLDFQNRATASGVFVSEGFNVGSTAFTPVTTGTGAYPTSDSPPGPNPRPIVSSTVFASGTGSMWYPLADHGGSTPNGFYANTWPQVLEANTTYYVQYRQRMDTNYINNVWPASGGGNTYFKHHIIAYGQGNNFNSCGTPAHVAINLNNGKYPTTYWDCGSPSFDRSDGIGGILDEQGDFTASLGAFQDSGWNCHHSTPNANTCFMYPADTWVTYTYKVQTGAWNSTGWTVQGWVQKPGEFPKMFVNITGAVAGFNFTEDVVGHGWSLIEMMPYYTNRNPAITLPTSNTWYDELIVSTSPIAPPMGPK